MNIKKNTFILSPNRIYYLVKNSFNFIILFILLLAIGYNNYFVRIISITFSTILLLVLIYNWLFIKSIKWKISVEQLIYERGVFNKKVSYIELYRIFDYEEKQSFVDQIINIKRIIIYSGDKSHPVLKIFGILNSIDVVNIIRERVELNKQIKHIYEISNT